MNAEGTHQYEMTLSLNVLKHLGFGLYSNVPAVLGEVVANAWDADAEHVSIEVDPEGDRITITDDGHGMTIQDANQRYLHVGYERRKAADGARTPRLNRPVMGRKGIGKLSLFSIAGRVEVHSVRGGDRHGFVMDAKAIERAITSNDKNQYHPEPVDQELVDLQCGTRIVLTGMKRKLQWSSAALRRRLARRFSIIGAQHHFQIDLNGSPISIEDRDYYDKLQYIWTFGERGAEVVPFAGNLKRHEQRPPELDNGSRALEIEGWLGTTLRSGQLKDPESRESLNRIVILVRGKLAQEDILEEFGEAGLYSAYLIGEIHADFLDEDDQEDIATTSRQYIVEHDPRYQALKSKLQSELKLIESHWTAFRNTDGTKAATVIPQINAWYQGLHADHRESAKRLFGKINQLPIDDPSQKRQVFISGILAFESLRFRNLLHRIEGISAQNIGALGDVFVQLDDLEASAYYQISKDRLEVIRRLTNLVDENVKEQVLQQHLFRHLWLLDPSWERAARTERMETRVARALDKVYQSLTPEQREARVDIQYATTGNKHVIVELKRAGRVLSTSDLLSQLMKYRAAVAKVLESQGKANEPLELVCVIGRSLSDWSDPNGRVTSANTLEGASSRVVMYDELIENAQQAYQDYLDRRTEAGRVHRLINSISVEDIQAMSPRPK